jgi:hypothetical protein
LLGNITNTNGNSQKNIRIMNEFKFTKGEWFACCTKSKPHFLFSAEGEITICGFYQKQEMGEDLTIEEMQANAKLIATAPELLDMLVIVLDCQSSENRLTSEINDLIKELIKKATL